MQIIRHLVPPLDTNCYLVSDGETLGIIDPGGGEKALIAAIEERPEKPAGIFLTHGHFDHAGAAAALRAHFQIPIFIHELDAPMLENAETSHAARFGFPYAGFSPDVCFKEGDTLPLETISFTALHTPGHTPGSSAFLAENVLFSGDTLFAGSIGNFPFLMAETMHKSFLRLLALPPSVRVFPGHADATTVLKEQKENPFLHYNWELASF